MGTVFAHDGNAYRRWASRTTTRHQPSLTGAALESAIMNIARLFPENVVRVPA